MMRGKFGYAGFEKAFEKDVDPYHIFIGLVSHMVDLARRAANEEAYSYRNFHVGAALIAFLPLLRETVLFSAGNTKHENQQKICAEKKLLQQLGGYAVAKESPAEVVGLVVVGTSDKTMIQEVTGRATSTLPPCEECNGMLHTNQLVTPETLLVTAGLDSDVHQIYSLDDLSSYYSNPDAPEVHAHQTPNFDNWHIRQAFYDYMVGPFGQPTGQTPAQIARFVLSSAFLDSANQTQQPSGITDTEELVILEKIAQATNPRIY